MRIIYWMATSTGEYYTETMDRDFFIGMFPSECEMIIPDFVRPIHYSIFEDE